jgi:RimJ/RimL family protein N-acetyltransferase
MSQAPLVRHPLEGDLVRLRAREESDVVRLNTMFDDPDVLAGLRMTFPQPAEGFLGWVRSSRDDPDSLHMVIETLDGEAVGACGYNTIDRRARDAEVGIWVGKPYWNRGYGSDAMRVLCRFGFRQMNLQRITLHVYETNPNARHVYDRLGFVLEGTIRRGQFVHGRHVDVHIMGLLVEAFADEA